MAKYDFLIKNGIIFDGENSAFTKNDIGIRNGKIKDIGKIEEKNASRVVDADNMYVCPGFIDLTNHSDTFWTIFSDPFQESLIRQGVTTILGGNCGSSLSPIISPQNIESVQKWTDISKINIDWQTMKEFLDGLQRAGSALNFATLVGHNTLRRNVMANTARTASEEDLKKMKFLLKKSLEEGAAGLSFNLSSAHEKSTSAEEIAELSRLVKEKNGLVKHHLEDEGVNILPSIAKVIGQARASQAKTQISHFKAIGRRGWENFDKAVSLIERAREENLAITIDVFPYEKTGSQLYLFLPEWILKDGKAVILASLREPKERESVLRYLEGLTLHYDKITVVSTLWDANAIGKTIAELSKSTGFKPEQVILNLLELNELKVSIFNEVIKKEHIGELLKKPWAMIASDGAGYDSSKFQVPSSKFQEMPHPRSFGAFPKVFREFVKEKEIISWQETIYKSTSFPAKILGLADRGLIKNGMAADIVIFDPEKIEDKATYENPFQFSSGIEWVFVNGEPALAEGKLTFKKTGKVLRRK